MIKITTLILGLLTLNGFSQEYKSVDEVLGIAIGETVSNFKAITNNADTFELQEALTNGPVLLIFYRGQWCSFCSRYLSKIQDSLSFIEAKGVTVFGVSPEKPTVSVIAAEKTKAEFKLLYDDGYEISNAFDLAFLSDNAKLLKYNGAVNANLKTAHSDDSQRLPVPATYIIGTNGKVIWRHFDVNYKKRASVTEILKQL